MPKIASLRNFPAVSEKGIYYAESFASRTINGVRVLTPTFSITASISNNTSGFSNLGNLVGMTSISLYSADITITSILGISDDSKIFHYAHVIGTSRGEVHTNTDGGSAPGIFTLDSENLLYTGATRVGIGYRGVCGSGSGTTKIIDSAGRNWSTYGVSSSTGHNKVYNFNNGQEYTITSISTTNSTNDTLNFSAGTANATGDIFIAFNDEGYGTDLDLFTTTAYPQYTSQKTQSAIIHQIRQFNDGTYYILNGKFLAQLDSDEHTFNDNAKELPANTEGTCLAINQGQILIGASWKGKGKLLLWNGFIDGFLSIIPLETAPQAMEAYSNGWIVVIGSSLYFTNGYSMTLVTTLPDADYFGATATVSYNGMKIVQDRVYLNVMMSGTNRAKSGTWIYDFKSGWSYLPSRTSSGTFLNGQTMGAIASVVSNGSNRLFTSYSSLNPAPSSDTSFIGRLFDQTGYNPNAIILIEFGTQRTVKKVTLGIGIKNIGTRTSSSATTAKIEVAVGDARLPLFRTFLSGTSNTTTLLKNTQGDKHGASAVLGQQIRIQKGGAAGERSYISSIANGGTTSEQLTLYPALSAAPSDSQSVLLMNLRSAKNSITITDQAVPERNQCDFIIEGVMYTDKIFLEVSVTGTDADLIEIHSVDIEGD